MSSFKIPKIDITIPAVNQTTKQPVSAQISIPDPVVSEHISQNLLSLNRFLEVNKDFHLYGHGTRMILVRGDVKFTAKAQGGFEPHVIHLRYQDGAQYLDISTATLDDLELRSKEDEKPPQQKSHGNGKHTNKVRAHMVKVTACCNTREATTDTNDLVCYESESETIELQETTSANTVHLNYVSAQSADDNEDTELEQESQVNASEEVIGKLQINKSLARMCMLLETPGTDTKQLERALNSVRQQSHKVKAWVNYVHKRLHHRHQLEHTATSRSSRAFGATTRRSARQEASQNSYDSSYKESQSELCDTQRVGEGAARNGKW
jgi:hypothetical protein